MEEGISLHNQIILIFERMPCLKCLTYYNKDRSEHKMAAGHIKSITVLYTAEIELRPVIGGVIGRRHDPETGTGFWSFGVASP